MSSSAIALVSRRSTGAVFASCMGAVCLFLGLIAPDEVAALPRPRLAVHQRDQAIVVRVRINNQRMRRKYRTWVQVSIDDTAFADLAEFRGKRRLRRFRLPLQDGAYTFRARVVAPSGRSTPWSFSKKLVVDDPAASKPDDGNSSHSAAWPALLPGLRECPGGVEQVIHREVNIRRAQHGLAPLSLSYELRVSARNHSIRMAARQELSHDGWFQEMFEAGFRGTHFAQNIATYVRDPHRLMEGWMASRDHQRNILNIKSRFSGVSCVVAADGTFYWTQNFGG